MKGGYVDGFVLSVPKSKTKLYKQMAGMMVKLCKKYGALDYKECRGDDLKAKKSAGWAPMSFNQMAKPKKGETVWFSYILYKNRKHRDQVNAKMMKDPIMNDPKMWEKGMPFDMNRMATGGFKVEVSI